MKIQDYVSKLDADKAVILASLEKELNARQEEILEKARKRIDDLNEEANRLKMVRSSRLIDSLRLGRFRAFYAKLKRKATLRSVR